MWRKTILNTHVSTTNLYRHLSLDDFCYSSEEFYKKQLMAKK